MALGEGTGGTPLVPPVYGNGGNSAQSGQGPSWGAQPSGQTKDCPRCGASMTHNGDNDWVCTRCGYMMDGNVTDDQRFVIDFEIKSVTESQTKSGTLILEGYANTWEEDRDGETVAKDAFDATISDFMTNPILLLNHKKEQVLGGVTYLEPDETGLWIRAEVDRPPEKAEGWAHKAYADIRNRRLKTFSMGGLFHRSKSEGDKIHRVDLYEISVVAVPSNKTSLFRVAAEKGFSFELKADAAKSPATPGFIMKGVKKMADEPAGAAATKDADVVTISKKDWEATQGVLKSLAEEKAQRDRDSEIERQAKDRIDAEQKQAQAEAEAKEARDAEIKAAVDERIKAIRASGVGGGVTGRKMTFGGDPASGQPGGLGQAPVKIADFMKALVAAKQGNPKAYEWLVGEDQKAAEAYGLKSVGEKAYTEGAFTPGTYSATGGFLVPPQYLQGSLAEFRLAQAKVRQLCTVLPGINSNAVLIPRETGVSAVGWTAENAAKPSTDATYGQISVGIYVLAGIAKVSKQLLNDSTPAVDMIVRRGLGKALGQAEDIAFINGTGSGQPTGILNTAGILTGAVGAKLWSSIAGAITTVQSNYFGNPTAIIAHPRDVNTLRTTVDTAGRPIFLPNYWAGGNPAQGGPQAFLVGGAANPLDQTYQASPPDGYVFGLPIYGDANMPSNLGGGTNETRMIIAAWEEAWIFEREGMGMDVSGEAGTSFEQNQFWFRIEERVGFTAARQTNAFYVMTGLTPGAGL